MAKDTNEVSRMADDVSHTDTIEHEALLAIRTVMTTEDGADQTVDATVLPAPNEATEDAPKKSRKQQAAPSTGERKERPFKVSAIRLRYVVLAGAVALAVFRPWLLVGLICLALALFLGSIMALGHESVWRRAQRFGQWYAKKSPERAARYWGQIERFTVTWDAFLDFFPEGTVDGLYLPDLADMAEADSRHDAAMDRRLAGLRETDA